MSLLIRTAAFVTLTSLSAMVFAVPYLTIQ